ncbi:membrane protein [Nocardiopsis terrae]|uniref:Fucose 4-O-acetylase-like acetyltransferase n=1 Tax=Nocardiopsis terrae TaxID=372655 RepID=A0ABR9HLA9_9ACTN|nr:acyltransferase family protein [Nocardiopsis terrae]MBE1459794.1 fucose 4-O-acetylase-like acetyltransferase [Nocardiopsis terrae]GHC93943.1 membrane protein [Nocardiopsis terrae]
MASSATSQAPRPRDDGPGATARTSEGRTEATAQPPGRDARLDNAKFILIALVVVGHAIQPLTGYGPAGALYYWIYFFHMPAFILISGYLSRSFDASSNRVEKLVLSLGVPYLLFWTAHQSIYTVQRGGLPDTLSVLQPTWTLWFLVALFLWRLSVPVWQRLRWPVAIAVAVSVFGATSSLGEILSMGRVVSFLPFFVLGLSLRREHFACLDRLWVRLCSVLVMGVTALLAVPISDRLSRDWLFWRASLTDRDIDPLLPSIGIRLAFMGLALVMTIAMLALTPKRRTWYTSLGSYTLFIYLGHSVFLLLLKNTPWYDVVSGPVGLSVTVSLALALILLLCTPWVRAGMRWAVEPQATWFLRQDGKGLAGKGTGASRRAAAEREKSSV